MTIISKKSFSARLSFYILLICSILFITMISIVAYSSHKIIADEATKNASNILKKTILEIEKVFEEVEVSTINMQWIIESVNNDEKAFEYITRKVIETNPHIVGSAIAFEPQAYKNHDKYSILSYKDNKLGEIVTKRLDADVYDYLTMDWYQIPKLLKEPTWSEPYYDSGGSNRLTATFSRPLIDSIGNVYAIFTADISMDWITEKVNSIHPYDKAYTFLIGRAGSYISHKDSSRITSETIFSVTMEMEDTACVEIAKNMVRGESGLIKFKGDEGWSFAVYGPLSNQWSVAIICSYKAILERTLQMNIVLILVGAFGLFLLFMLCLLTIRKITKPITQFSESALSIAKGNFNTKLPIIHSHDELKTLHDSFVYMQLSLQTYIEELQTTTAVNERLESELNIARNIQMQMVPKNFPQGEKFDLYASVEPAKEVGGDLYDFFVKDNKLYFAIGDVSGKGIPASLFMAVTRSTFHFIARANVPMDMLVEKLNNCLSEGNESMLFVTMFAGVIDLTTKEFCYCNAGHNPIIIKHNGKQAQYLKVESNLALGLMENFKYKMECCQLSAGTRLLLYTDGVTEAENPQKELYGEDRLLKWANSIQNSISAQQSIELLRNDIRIFTNGAEQNDDITILTITI